MRPSYTLTQLLPNEPCKAGTSLVTGKNGAEIREVKPYAEDHTAQKWGGPDLFSQDGAPPSPRPHTPFQVLWKSLLKCE